MHWFSENCLNGLNPDDFWLGILHSCVFQNNQKNYRSSGNTDVIDEFVDAVADWSSTMTYR